MRNKILLTVVILLIGFVVLVRYLFANKFEVFKKSVSQFESKQHDKFVYEKEIMMKSIALTDKDIYNLFVANFDERKSVSKKDTTFSFLYLSGSITYSKYAFLYLECLNEDCSVISQNKKNEDLINQKELELKEKYGYTFTLWYRIFKDSKLVVKSTQNSNCKNFFTETSRISYNENAWKEFDFFLNNYKNEISASEAERKGLLRQFEFKKANVIRQLVKGNAISFFENRLEHNATPIFYTDSVSKTYNSLTLGNINYKIPATVFNESAFQNISDESFEEQWKNNSLTQGSMPYSSCYGSSNYCNGYGCSEIRIKTGSYDVLTSIKDVSGDVIRHAYIKAGRTFTFNIPDGSYQVFFYSGTGWNPNKVITTPACGKLYGGFVSNEDFQKDSYKRVQNQIRTIELIYQTNGNFSTQKSSQNEALN